MKRFSIKRTIAVVLFCSLLYTSSAYAETTQSDIDDTHSKIEDLQQQKEDAQDTVDDLAGQKTELEGNLSNLNQQLTQITGEMNKLEDQIKTKEEEIAKTDEDILVAEGELKEAEAQATQQYEDMKIRIQYMYENGNTTMLQMLLESESVADFLNRSEYISQINEYDRNMLETYNQLQQDIATQKEELENTREQLAKDKDELVAMEEEVEKKKNNVDSLIASTKSSINEAASNLSDAQSDVSSLEGEIANMEALEEQLELQKAQEDAARLAAIKEEEQEDLSNIEVSASDGDLYLLGAIIQCEAEGESYEGKLAVGSVIINRVKSSYFPGSISGVVYQSGQFSPVASGRLAYRLGAGVNSECLQAAQAVLDGQITLNCLYFRRNNGVIQGTVIGNHVFY